MTSIPVGLCQCGCGQMTTVIRRSRGKGTIGKHNRFVEGHNGRRIGDGKHYPAMSDGAGRVRDVHRVVAELALGKRLPRTAQVHHVDGNHLNNANRNLVICENQAYHQLLHMRTKVVRAGGNPNTEVFCNACERARSRDCFSAFPKHFNGLASRCKECLAAAARAKQTKRVDAATRYWHAVETIRISTVSRAGSVLIPSEAYEALMAVHASTRAASKVVA